MAQLTERVADSLRRRIVAGEWPVGTTLPTFLRLAKDEKVGMKTVRRAVAQLAREGFVDPRRGVGSVVLDKDAGAFRGFALFVTAGRSFNYYASVVASEVEERLASEGFVLSRVSVHETAHGKLDFSVLDLQYELKPTLVVLMAIRQEVVEWVASRHVPYLMVNPRRRPVRTDESSRAAGGRCVGSVCFSAATAMAALRDWIAESGVTSVLEIGLENAGTRRLKAVGKNGKVSMKFLDVRADDRLPPMEHVTRPAYESTLKWLQKHQRLPDLVFFADDFVAQGSLQAFAARGYVALRDFKVAVFANRGNMPHLLGSYAAVVNDPFAQGAAIAAAVSQAVASGFAFAESVIEAGFVLTEAKD